MAYRRRCWTRPLERRSRPDLAPAEQLTPTPTFGDLRDLAAPPGNRLEALSGKRKGQHIQVVDSIEGWQVMRAARNFAAEFLQITRQI